MDDASLVELCQPHELLEPLFSASSSSSPPQSIEILIEAAKTDDGRSDLAAKNILPSVLNLIQSSARKYLLPSLKLLRNLCAGEILNQNSFIECDGVGVVSAVLGSAGLLPDPDIGIVRMCLQVLANVSLAGEKHQRAVWHRFFPNEFVALARVQNRDTCDPLCMIVYICCDGCPGLVAELCRDQGLVILAEIVQTVSAVGFGEDWFKILLSRICIEEIYFGLLFSKLHQFGVRDEFFSSGQAFLLRCVSEIVNEQFNEVSVLNDFGLCVLGIFKRSVGFVDFVSRGKCGLPTGSAAIDILGFSLTILRDICARDNVGGIKDDAVDVVETLISDGLVELLLCLLRDLERPAIVRKALIQSGNQEVKSSNSAKLCPYKGFRRDIVAVIGNCAYRRKHVQDEIRQKNGILLMLQHCVTDEDNPFLREWGIWSTRNILEGNAENQQVVADLELQGSVDVPELADVGLKVEVDQESRRAKLVNVS
ncbi:Atx10homo_assoc domain-containing protein [Cephalotus follicularis]|uniref:Atx10homo_assoc domain-containing protein n=1 Tax=Cephalotus follicularis TaxID=3775 RepID=A0A1Q3D586_CEPFO|nr:Atx10homo_assoc domain-containing protein [Cephalotus follicularis]